MYTLEDFKAGKVAIRNDGTLEQLEMVLRYVFPQDKTPIRPYWKYLYFTSLGNNWNCADATRDDMPCQRIQSFVNQIAEKRQIAIINSSIEKLISDLREKSNQIGLDCEVIFKQKQNRWIQTN